MLEECPILQQRFGAVGMEHFIMFKVKVENVEYYGAFCSSRPELEQHHSGQKAAALEACDILAISSRLLAPSITARP